VGGEVTDGLVAQAGLESAHQHRTPLGKKRVWMTLSHMDRESTGILPRRSGLVSGYTRSDFWQVRHRRRGGGRYPPAIDSYIDSINGRRGFRQALGLASRAVAVHSRPLLKRL